MATADDISMALEAARAAGDAEGVKHLEEALQRSVRPQPAVPAPVAPAAPAQPEPKPSFRTELPPEASIGSNLSALTQGLAQGGSDIMSLTVDPAMDLFSGDKLGTANEERRQGIERFGKENVTPGNAATTMNVIGRAGSTMLPLARAAQGVRAAGVASPMLANAIANAGFEGAKTGAQGGDAGDIGISTALGAGGSLLGDTVARGLGGLRTAATPYVKNMIENGWLPTPGQATGPVGQAVENFVGRMFPSTRAGINAGRAGSAATYSTAEANKVASRVGGMPTKEVGEGAVAASERSVDAAYDAVKPFIQMTPGARVTALRDGLTEVMGQGRLSGQEARRVLGIVGAEFRPYIGANRLTGAQWKVIDSNLGAEARRLEASSVVAEQRQGDALRIFQRHLRDALGPVGGAPSTVLDALNTNNRAFFENLSLRNAATAASSRSGKFSPTQLHRAQDRVGMGPEGTAEARTIMENTPRMPGGPGNFTPSLPKTLLGIGGAGYVAKQLDMDPHTFMALMGITGMAALGGGRAAMSGASRAVNSPVGRSIMLKGMGGNITPEQAQFLSRIGADQAQ